ncbi:hypothetical protein BH09ACT6_BH09ACT6_14690 [soil metagenome]
MIQASSQRPGGEQSGSERPGGTPLMRVSVVRSGGFAGVIRTWHADATDEAEAADWRKLLDSCTWNDEAAVSETPVLTPPVCTHPSAAPPEATPRAPMTPEAAPPGADRFVYRISVVSATPAGSISRSDHDREATLSESQLTGPWRDLIDRVKRAAPQ